jgi:hypothetical protein
MSPSGGNGTNITIYLLYLTCKSKNKPMKQNRSLAISVVIQEQQKTNLLNLLEGVFPKELLERKKPDKSRDRVFTPINTLLTMVLTATQSDKSLKNSVALYYGLHQRIREKIYEDTLTKIKEQEAEERMRPKVGRPRKKQILLPKSKEKDISLNTAAYSKARSRLPLEMTSELFKASSMKDIKNTYSHWHERKVLIVDGTYLQMQDTKELRKQYKVKRKKGDVPGYPQGLLLALIERGTGQLRDYKLSNRRKSELALFYDMLDTIEQGSLVLGDDLYNCYEIIAKCVRKNIDIVVPAKRKRNYRVIKKISNDDEIIEIKKPIIRSSWLKEEDEIQEKLTLRKIKSISPEGKEYLLYTTILDESIKSDEFKILFFTRWDVEIGIREIKTIMDVNILRSKTPEMVLKELNVSLATYNLIRQIIYEGIKEMPFSPKEDFIQKFYHLNKNVFIDKKGRVYSRWSPGRRGAKGITSQRDASIS